MDHPLIAELEARFGEQFITDLSERVSEMCWDEDMTCGFEEGEDGYVWIHDRAKQDVINMTASGCFWAGGIEYAFEVDNGNNNGFVWRSVDAEGAIKDLDRSVTQYTLAPNRTAISNHIENGSGPGLIKLWDAFMERPELAEIPGKYAYDKFFQPGGAVKNYWEAKADKAGMVITTVEDAAEIRARLETATTAHDMDLSM
jgi:hypothetical protein